MEKQPEKTMPLNQAVREISKLQFSDEHKAKVRKALGLPEKKANDRQ